MRLSTVCGSWFACASIAVPDCDRIWSFVKFSISWLISASRIRLSAAVRFVPVVVGGVSKAAPKGLGGGVEPEKQPLRFADANHLPFHK